MNHSSYLKKAFNLQDEINDFVECLEDFDFDSIVCTGTSGLIVGSVLSHVMNKRLIVVRKENDNSHASHEIENAYPGKAIFVDDLIDSGSTFINVIDKIYDFNKSNSFWSDEKLSIKGVFLYGSCVEFTFYDLNQKSDYDRILNKLSNNNYEKFINLVRKFYETV